MSQIDLDKLELENLDHGDAVRLNVAREVAKAHGTGEEAETLARLAECNPVPKTQAGPAQFAWDESAHPRQPKGTMIGGEFKAEGAPDAPPSLGDEDMTDAMTEQEQAEEAAAAVPTTEELEAKTPPPKATYPKPQGESDISQLSERDVHDRLQEQSPYFQLSRYEPDKPPKTLSGMTPSEVALSVVTYQGTAYRHINRALRDCPDPPYDCAPPEIRGHIDVLRKLMQHAPSLPNGLTTWRGVGPNAGFSIDDFAEANAKKYPITLKGLTSSSLSRDTAQNTFYHPGGLLFKVRPKKGVYIGASEREMVQDHGTQYRVKSISESSGVPIVEIEETEAFAVPKEIGGHKTIFARSPMPEPNPEAPERDIGRFITDEPGMIEIHKNEPGPEQTSEPEPQPTPEPEYPTDSWGG